MARLQPWKCPRCRRHFANRNQNHSCKPSKPVSSYFEDRPAWMRAAFNKIARQLGTSIRIEGVAKGLHLANRSTFAGVRMTRSGMVVEFLLEREIKSPRISKVERLGPARIAHHVTLSDAGADDELIEWLKASRDQHA